MVEEELGGSIPYQHTSKASDKHESEKDRSWLRAGNVENAGKDHAVNVSLAQGRGDGEAADEKHNGWRKHDREDVSERRKG